MALDTIAVGLDGSAAATNALGWAVNLGLNSKAAVRALHVWQAPYLCTYPGLTPSTEATIENARAIVDAALQELHSGADVASRVVRGAPGPALTAESAAADLLVVGRTGNELADRRAEFGEIVVGSAARYCLNHAGTPVAAVPERAVWVPAPNVIVGVDGSETSMAALRWAMEELPDDAHIHAVHAIVMPSDNDETPIDYELLDPIVDANEKQLRHLVDTNTPGSFRSSGRSVHCKVIVGFAPDALIEPGFGCDVIVVGEHGETATANNVLGSVADHTLRYAPVPIVVVPSPRRTQRID